jgi:hypothetical protein
MPPDDGVIDVRNMCTSGGQVKSRTAPLYVQETPGSAFSMSIRPPGRTNAFALGGIAAGAVALVLVIGVGFAVTRKGDEAAQPHLAAAISHAPTVQVEGPAAVTPSNTASATPATASGSDTTAAATAASDPAPASKSGKRGYSSRGLSKVSSGGVSSSSQSSVSSSPPKFVPPKAKSGGGGAADPCHCHGNLACAMKCSM